MHSWYKRILSLTLSLALLLCLLPASALAEELAPVAETPDGEEEYVQIAPEKEIKRVLAEEIATSRDAFTKELVQADGTHTYAVYPLAVHYDADGQWEEIDNTLKRTDTGYMNTAGAWEIALPENMGNDNQITVTYKGHELSYALQGIKSAEGQIQKNSLAEEDSWEAQTTPVGFSSALLYPGVKENADLRYDLISHQLKESLVYSSLPEEMYVSYSILGEGLTFKLNEDNSLSVLAEEEELFVWDAPYLYDAEGESCFEIAAELEESEEGWLLTYRLPEDWLQAEERAYPVVLDPTVKPAITIANTRDQTVFTSASLSYSWGAMQCGRSSNYGLGRFYIQYVNLPTLTSADVVVEAYITLYKLNAATDTLQVNVHKPLAAWTQESITWSNQPAYESTVQDYSLVTDEGTYYWDVTDIARYWYEGKNYGMMFKVTDTMESSGNEYKRFASSNWGGANMPTLYLSYVNNNGIESGWDYETTAMGRAGTGYVSDYTGNLVWVHDDMGFDGNKMPVSIQHIYNSNDRLNNDYGMGYGWKTNYNQRVEQWSTDSSYYYWDDEDGTRQYFKYKSSGKYEDEKGSGLVLTTTGSGSATYKIADDRGNARYFDSSGRLTKIENNQATKSSIQITYDSNNPLQINTVTDGAGRTYDFVYTNGFLTRIDYYGTTYDTSHTVYFTQSYSYSSSGLLNRITDRDGKYVTYNYAAYLLVKATDTDGAEVCYHYLPWIANSVTPYRVDTINVSQNGVSGGGLTMTYAHNETIITDHNGNTEILQFSDWGNTSCVQDDEGNAQHYRYAEEKTNGDISKVNQLTRSSKLQATTVNLILNGSFEKSFRWQAASGNASGGSWGYSNSAAYFGKYSLYITGASSGSYSVKPLNAQPWQAGTTYTLSGYIKTSTAGAKLQVISGSSVLAETESAPTDSQWHRVEVTFTCPSGNPEIRLTKAASGTAWFDGVQVEVGSSATRYNLAENGDFYYADSDYYSGAWGWSSTTAAITYGHRASAASSATDLLDSNSYHISGQAGSMIQAVQTIEGNGSAGDVYTFTGWGKGDSVALTAGTSRQFSLALKFNYANGTSETFTADFNPDADSGNHWQYAAGCGVATRAYSSVKLYLCYDYNANEAWFDGIGLYKEEYGHSYVYNSDGKLVSATDLQKETTTYEYSNNNLTRAVTRDANGSVRAKMEYEYDSYHNVTKATTLEGQVTEFAYDSYGNNTRVSKVSGSETITATAVYSNSGNTLSTVTDTLENITTYGYNPQTGKLHWVRLPGETDANKQWYYFDSMYRVYRASKGSTNNYYTYANNSDLLSVLENGSGTDYTFNSTSFGQTDSVAIGSRTPVSNSYSSDGNRNLTQVAYGNGNTVAYSYDSHNRLTGVVYGTGTVGYEYNPNGSVGKTTDGIGGRTTKYLYDLSGRSVGFDEQGTNYSNSVLYGYDDSNNVSTVTQKLNGSTYTTNYTYDRDNRVTAINNGSTNSANTYNGFGQLTRIQEKAGSSVKVTTDITYNKTQVSQWTNTITNLATGNSTDTFTYIYDQKGNITSVSDGTYTTSYVYDHLNQLTRENNQKAGKTWVYGYDNGGNVLSKTEYTYTTGTLGGALNTKSFSYGDSAWKDLLTAVNGQSRTNDAIGNVLGDGEWTYTWQNGRQLAGMSKSGTTIRYAYNADGMRISKTVNGTETEYSYLGSQLVEMKKGSDTLHFTYDSIGPATVVFNGTTYYYLKNAQGDICGIADSSGTQVVSYSYDAWGRLLGTSGSATSGLGALNPLRYRGYVYDTETGFYYLQTRYYNPEICRFINADVISNIGNTASIVGFGLFLYCENNPCLGFDPDGCVNLGGVIVGLGILAGVAITVSTFGIGSGLGAVLAMSAVATGTTITTAAVRESAMVVDFSVSAPQSVSSYHKSGFSMIVDFSDNGGIYGYQHGGGGVGKSTGASFSVGFVDNLDKPSDYSKHFADANVGGVIGIDHCFDPTRQYKTATKATSVTIGVGFNGGIGYDYYSNPYIFFKWKEKTNEV